MLMLEHMEATPWVLLLVGYSLVSSADSFFFTNNKDIYIHEPSSHVCFGKVCNLGNTVVMEYAYERAYKR
jgi:hypothetical protein